MGQLPAYQRLVRAGNVPAAPAAAPIWSKSADLELGLILVQQPDMADRMTRMIEYLLNGAGWAQGAVVLDGRRITLDASYIHDTFSDIVEALRAACEGQQAVEWVYFHEPASTHVYLTRADGRRVIALRRFPDFRSRRPRLGHPGKLIAEGEVLLRQLVSDVIIAGSRMIDAHGEQGYLQSWGHPFPTRAFADLRELRSNSELL